MKSNPILINRTPKDKPKFHLEQKKIKYVLESLRAPAAEPG